MDLRRISRTWFNKFYHEDIYGYIENRFFPVVYKYLSQTYGKVLDAACGYGNPYLERMDLDKFSLVGIDIDPSVRSRNKIHNNFIINDLHNFESSEKFEAIISVNTWEHLHSPELVLKNFYNNLTEKGLVIIVAPQRWHYINSIATLLPYNLKNLAWKILKGQKCMPFPVFYRLCSKGSLISTAHRLNYRLLHFSSVEGPPLWFAKIPPLFISLSMLMSVYNNFKIFDNIRSTFIAVLQKK